MMNVYKCIYPLSVHPSFYTIYTGVLILGIFTCINIGHIIILVNIIRKYYTQGVQKLSVCLSTVLLCLNCDVHKVAGCPYSFRVSIYCRVSI